MLSTFLFIQFSRCINETRHQITFVNRIYFRRIDWVIDWSRIFIKNVVQIEIFHWFLSIKHRKINTIKNNKFSNIAKTLMGYELRSLYMTEIEIIIKYKLNSEMTFVIFASKNQFIFKHIVTLRNFVNCKRFHYFLRMFFDIICLINQQIWDSINQNQIGFILFKEFH